MSEVYVEKNAERLRHNLVYLKLMHLKDGADIADYLIGRNRHPAQGLEPETVHWTKRKWPPWEMQEPHPMRWTAVGFDFNRLIGLL